MSAIGINLDSDMSFESLPSVIPTPDVSVTARDPQKTFSPCFTCLPNGS